MVEKYRAIAYFKGTQVQISDGSIRYIPKTNIAYIEPHKLVINNITYLFFNEYNDIYINTLVNSIPFNDLEAHIKANKTKPIDIKIKK